MEQTPSTPVLPASKNSSKTFLIVVLVFLIFLGFAGVAYGAYAIYKHGVSRRPDKGGAENAQQVQEVDNADDEENEDESPAESDDTPDVPAEDADAGEAGGAGEGGDGGAGEVPAECVSTLTADDLDFMSAWPTYTNAAQGYSLRYPDGWTVNTSEDQFVVLEYAGYYINFQFRSAEMSAFGIDPSFTVDSETPTVVACEDATEVVFSQDTERLMLVTFTHNDVPHAIMMSYTYLGASVSGDIIDAFHLILKSVEF